MSSKPPWEGKPFYLKSERLQLETVPDRFFSSVGLIPGNKASWKTAGRISS